VLVATTTTTSMATTMIQKSCLVWLSIVDAPLTPKVGGPAGRLGGTARRGLFGVTRGVSARRLGRKLPY
jgi:hypothetical protein